MLKRKRGAKERFYLTRDRRSWVDVSDVAGCAVPDDIFQQLMALKPEARGQIKSGGRVIDLPRYVKSYGKAYFFSGMQHEAEPIPACIRPLVEWANGTEWAKERGWTFNQALVNWLPDGHHYVGEHADDERPLDVRDECTPVLGISWGAERMLRLRPMKGKEGTSVDLRLPSGTLYVMGGRTQRTHKHQVPKIGGKKGLGTGPRVSVTLRCFKKN